MGRARGGCLKAPAPSFFSYRQPRGCVRSQGNAGVNQWHRSEQTNCDTRLRDKHLRFVLIFKVALPCKHLIGQRSAELNLIPMNDQEGANPEDCFPQFIFLPRECRYTYSEKVVDSKRKSVFIRPSWVGDFRRHKESILPSDVETAPRDDNAAPGNRTENRSARLAFSLAAFSGISPSSRNSLVTQAAIRRHRATERPA